MARFLPAIAFVLGNEGPRLLDDPSTGEYSRWGVTLKLLRQIPTTELRPLGLKATKECIRTLSRKQAEAFYEKFFWNHYAVGLIVRQTVANKVLDMLVNMQPRPAVRIVQRACNALGGELKVDGIMGNLTFSTVNEFQADPLLEQVRHFAELHYRAIVESNPGKYGKYLNGWVARARK